MPGKQEHIHDLKELMKTWLIKKKSKICTQELRYESKLLDSTYLYD